jgi:hypothetical protein
MLLQFSDMRAYQLDNGAERSKISKILSSGYNT